MILVGAKRGIALELLFDESLLEKEGVEEMEGEMEITSVNGVENELELLEAVSIEIELVLIHWEEVVEGFDSNDEVPVRPELELIRDDEVVEELKVLEADWRVVFDAAFAWWAGEIVFLLDE